MVLLTIGIPTFNRRAKLEKILPILLKEAEPYRNKIDIIVSNNNSTDSTDDYIKEKILPFYHISYFFQSQNIGPDRNFKFILDHCSSKYAWILSDDDSIFDDSIKTIISFLETNQSLSIVFQNTVYFKNGKPQFPSSEPLYKIDNDTVTFDKSYLISKIGIEFTFVSSIIFSISEYKAMDSTTLASFCETNWFQAYVFLLSTKGQKKIGLIKKPSMINNLNPLFCEYNIFSVFGDRLQKLLTFAYLNCGYNKKQMNSIYVNRLSNLKGSIIKDKLVNYPNFYKRFWPFFRCTFKFLVLWFTIYPICCTPAFVFKLVFRKKRKELSNQIRRKKKTY